MEAVFASVANPCLISIRVEGFTSAGKGLEEGEILKVDGENERS